MVKSNNKVNKTALTIFSVAAAVVLIGGLAVVVIPAATTAYADATTCLSLSTILEACHTVGKNPESCVTFFGSTECDEDVSNKDTGKFTGSARRNCAQSEVLECSVEGGPPER